MMKLHLGYKPAQDEALNHHMQRHLKESNEGKKRSISFYSGFISFIVPDQTRNIKRDWPNPTNDIGKYVYINELVKYVY